MALNSSTGVLYVTDSESKTVHAFSLDKSVSLGVIKCSNARVGKLLINLKDQRLYCSTKEGLLLFFDISKLLPRPCHIMKLVKTPELERNYVKQMEFDAEKNFIVVRMKNSDVILIQLIDSRLNKLHITESLKFKSFADT